jgi:hypothetical protein
LISRLISRIRAAGRRSCALQALDLGVEVIDLVHGALDLAGELFPFDELERARGSRAIVRHWRGDSLPPERLRGFLLMTGVASTLSSICCIFLYSNTTSAKCLAASERL